MHQSSLEKMTRFRDVHLADSRQKPLIIYDLGSLSVSGGSYRPVFEQSPWTYRGIDLAPGPNVDIVISKPYCWSEIPAESADVLVSGQAFEHIEFFWLTIFEIRRVLKPGGLLCLIAPSGGPIHRYPVDCWRFYPDGFQALARLGGLAVLDLYMQDGPTGYDDGSDMWQDLVLTARKPFRGRGLNRMKFKALHLLLRWFASGALEEAKRATHG